MAPLKCIKLRLDDETRRLDYNPYLTTLAEIHAAGDRFFASQLAGRSWVLQYTGAHFARSPLRP